MLKELSKINSKEKSKYGKILNIVKNNIESLLEEKNALLYQEELFSKINKEKIDVTLPTAKLLKGTIHPLSKTLDEIICIMGNLGFSLAKGPHIEDDYHNFTALNIPTNHPARQEHDTFYIKKRHNRSYVFFYSF